jgi:Na+-transporting methylmalonyl-CoA/oxaloacetate decarboxylase gamma subunit
MFPNQDETMPKAMIPLAAALSDQPGLWDAISYQVVGLLVVFAALGSIWLLMELMGFIFRSIEARRQAKAAAAFAAAPAVPLDLPSVGVRPEIIAVITAAAHTNLRAGEHIVAIHPLGRDHDQEVRVGAWSSEGRRQHFGSHKVR